MYAKPPGYSAVTNALLQYKFKALAKGRAWELTREQFIALIEGDCFYCGAPPSMKAKASNGSPVYILRNGIDRLNNCGGYIQGNVVPCCSTCNMAKRDMSPSQFIDWASRVTYHNSPPPP
jgi:hypothetical protein